MDKEKTKIAGKRRWLAKRYVLCSCRLHWQTSSGSANILMLKEHFVWFCMHLHLTGLLTYSKAFLINIMLWKQTNFISLQYITWFWIWNYETWFSCDILESLNQKKLGLIGIGDGSNPERTYRGLTFLASGFFLAAVHFCIRNCDIWSQFHRVLNRTQLERNDRRLWRNVCHTETTD